PKHKFAGGRLTRVSQANRAGSAERNGLHFVSLALGQGRGHSSNAGGDLRNVGLAQARIVVGTGVRIARINERAEEYDRERTAVGAEHVDIAGQGRNRAQVLEHLLRRRAVGTKRDRDWSSRRASGKA